MIKYSLIIICLLFIIGCASVDGKFDDKGNLIGATGYGIAWRLKVEQVRPDGSRNSYSSESTFSDSVNAINKAAGTLIDGAGKFMP